MSTDSEQQPGPDDRQTRPSLPEVPVSGGEQESPAELPASGHQAANAACVRVSVSEAAQTGCVASDEDLIRSVSLDGSPNSGHRPGPGLPAAVIWTLSVFVFHLAGIVISSVVLFLVNSDILRELVANPGRAEKILNPFLEGRAIFLLGGEMLFFVLSAMLATRWQHGAQTARILGLRGIPFSSLVLIVLSVVPLSVLCSGLHEKALPLWERVADRFPALDVFSGMNVNQQLGPLSESVPAWALLLVIAVAPAIGEELIFRGIIGHGLVARYGIWIGVLLTSVFFAVVHLHPAHVLTLLPLAVFLHLSWLATRSFYAPVLIHFLNNALAVFVLKNASELKEAARINEAGEAGWPGILLSAFVLIPAVISLWKNRVEYRLPDHSCWTPGYETAALPPDETRAAAVTGIRHRGMYTVGVVLCGALSLTTVFETLHVLRHH